MTVPVRVGIIGFGMSAQTFHAPVITKVPGLKLTVIGSSKPDAVHAKYPDVAVCPVDDVIEHPDVDVVVITAPSGLHYELCKRTLSAGKHVLCEKPVTTTEAEALELVELAHRAGKLCMAYQNRRYTGDFLTIQQLISEGRLGEVKTFEAHYDRYRPFVRARWREQAGPGAGLLYDLGSHLLDQSIALFGMPTHLTADIGYQRNGPTDDFFHIVLGYPSGLRVILHTSSFAPHPGPAYQVHGTTGSFIKCGMDPQEDQLKAGMQPGDPGYGEEAPELYGTLAVVANEDGSKLDISRPKTVPGCYQVFYDRLRDAVRANDDSSITTIRDAAKTAKLIDACHASSEEKRTVTF